MPEKPIGTMPDFQLLCGGFPCQTFSIAGSRKDSEIHAALSSLNWPAWLKPGSLRICCLKMYPVLSHDGGRTFATILNTLDQLGYGVEWQCLNSKDFCVPSQETACTLSDILMSDVEEKPFTETAGSSLIQTHGGHQGARLLPEGLSCMLAPIRAGSAARPGCTRWECRSSAPQNRLPDGTGR